MEPKQCKNVRVILAFAITAKRGIFQPEWGFSGPIRLQHNFCTGTRSSIFLASINERVCRLSLRTPLFSKRCLLA